MNKNSIKMIVLDLDGTLLNSKSKITLGTKEILKECIDAGYKVIIATGRNYIEAKDLTEGIAGLTYITSNGSYIVGNNGSVIANRFIPHIYCKRLVKIIKEHRRLALCLHFPGYIAIGRKLDYLRLIFLIEAPRDFFSLLRKLSLRGLVSFIVNRKIIRMKEVGDIGEFVKENCLEVQKIFVAGSKENLEPVRKIIQAEFGGKIKITTSGENNLEFNSEGVSKGKALEHLSKKWDIAVNRSIAFGDGGNDLELFDVAGIAVVMSNSQCSELKMKADLVADSNDKDGVAKILSNLLEDAKIMGCSKKQNMIV